MSVNTTIQNGTKSFANRFKMKTVTENSRTYGKTSVKKQLIKYLEKEIQILSSRENLELIYPTKMDGKQSKVKEIRSWKQSSSNPNSANVVVRHRG